MIRLGPRDLPDLQGPAAWNAILGPVPPRAPLTGARTADVAIVGAGFAGLSAARRLRQLDPALRVTVLEAGQVAEGSAGRNSGFMIDLPHDLASTDYAGAGDDRAVTRLNRHAIDFARAAVEEYAIRPDYFDPSGKVNGAAGPRAEAHNRSYAAHLATLGEPCQMLDAQDMRQMTGSPHYLSGLFTPGTVTLQPAGYIRGLAQGVERQRVVLHEGSPVTGLSRQGTAWSVQTPQGTLSAGQVILTVNGHLERFGFARGKLMHLFLFAVMTPDLGSDQQRRLGGRARWGITPSDPMGTTVRRIDSGQGGNRIITRSCAVLRPGMRLWTGDLARAARVMQRKFDSRFPQLAGLKMEYTWSGQLCLSRNGVSVTRQLDAGLYAGCVQNGLGTTRGTLTGIGAAELALGVDSDVTRHFVPQARPTRLPPRPLLDIGANAALRLREWRARNE